MAHRDQANRGSGSERQSVERTEDQRAAEEAGEGGREGREREGRDGGRDKERESYFITPCSHQYTYLHL